MVPSVGSLSNPISDVEKDLETARALQFAINGIIGVLTSAHGNMVASLKSLPINEGLGTGICSESIKSSKLKRTRSGSKSC